MCDDDADVYVEYDDYLFLIREREQGDMEKEKKKEKRRKNQLVPSKRFFFFFFLQTGFMGKGLICHEQITLLLRD